MTDYRHLAAGARVAQPWRNGGGVTREILTFPAGASDDDFLWRASIATIADAGPFSPWPGVDRALLSLRGKARLTMGHDPERVVEAGTPPIMFGGEAAVTARPIGGPCLVFNLMARRGEIQMRLERRIAAEPITAAQCLLLAEQPTMVRFGNHAVALATYDVLLLAGATPAGLAWDRPVIVAEIGEATRTRP